VVVSIGSAVASSNAKRRKSHRTTCDSVDDADNDRSAVSDTDLTRDVLPVSASVDVSRWLGDEVRSKLSVIGKVTVSDADSES